MCSTPTLPTMPPQVDPADAAIRAASYSATQKKLNQSSGRQASFLTSGAGTDIVPTMPKTLLGQ